MKKFKEWLSDYLEVHPASTIGALLAFTLITFGVQTWLIVKRAGSPQTANTQTEETQAASSRGGAIEILTEASTETESEKETQTETASETERQSETNSEPGNNGAGCKWQPAVRLLTRQLRQMRPELPPRQQHRPILPRHLRLLPRYKPNRS